MSILLDSVTTDPAWLLEQEGFDPSLERDLEALFTVGNGYVGIRGSLSVPIPTSETDAFIAGIYDRKTPSTPYSELELLESATVNAKGGLFRELVSFPSPFEVELRTGGESLTPENARNEEFIRRLDLKNGSVFERLKWRLPDGRELLFHSARTAFLADPQILLQEIRLRASGGDIPLQFLMKTLGSDLATVHTHLKKLSVDPGELGRTGISGGAVPTLALLQTSNSAYRVALGSKAWRDGTPVSAEELQWVLEAEVPSVILRAWVVRTNRDCLDPARTAFSSLEAMKLGDLKEAFSRHREKWGKFWAVADIRFRDCPDLTDAQRFSSYHLRATASTDPNVGIGARALSGRAYEGHVFWDSEIFVLPFLLKADPELARAKLEYRHRTLEGARRRARSMGCEGACYAWESTVTGDDVTPELLVLRSSGKTVPIFTGAQQIHVTADVAFAVFKYAEATQDDDWVCDQGMEILVETSRFWASRVTAQEGRYHILRVVGPDEYHHDVNDNAYTNWMARFNLRATLELAERIGRNNPGKWEELTARLQVRPEEIRHWDEVAERIYFPGPNAQGVIEQFSGYYKLKPVPLRYHQETKAPIERLFSWKKANEEQLIKQADVLMIPFLFPDAFSREVIRANYLYYEPRTDHASSLSPGVHAAVAARAGRWEDTNHFWRTGLHLDLLNLMQNTALGLHLGNMGATWQALVFHILGLPNSAAVPSDVREEFLRTYGSVELCLGGKKGGERVVYESQWKLAGSG